jgi:type II secretory pathway component PulJ
MRCLSNRKYGFTLIEMLIYVLLLSFVMVLLFQFANVVMKKSTNNENKIYRGLSIL